VRTVCDDLGLPVNATGPAAMPGGIQRTAADAGRLRELRAYLAIS